MKAFHCPRWGRWFSSGIKSVCLDEKGLYLTHWNRQPPIKLEWSDIPMPPIIKSWWLLNVVSFFIGDKKIDMRLLGKEYALLVFTELSQAWYSHRMTDIIDYFSQLNDRLQKTGYCRTSEWMPIAKDLGEWGKHLPQVPDEKLLPKDHYEFLLKAHLYVRDPSKYLQHLRRTYIARVLKEHENLFDTVESMPLTESQRLACVIDENNNLVLAGAGTGKTSTIMGRVAFLIQSNQAKPEDVLLLAFGNKAAQEMRDRLESKLGIKGFTASTFHALGQDILSRIEGRKPAISPLANDESAKQNFVQKEFEELQVQPVYRKQLLQYFEQWLYPEKNPFDFKSLGEYYRFLDDNDIRTLNGEKIKSYSECMIANFLFRMGVKYQYEAAYPNSPLSPEFRIYTPDFFLPEYGIYIEHFGIDRHGNTAPYIDQKKYLDGMDWKRNLHHQWHTVLVETFHYEQQEGILLDALEEKLKQNGVIFNPLPPETTLEKLREFGTISAFAKLLCDLLTLLKAAHLSPGELEEKISCSPKPEQLKAVMVLLSPIISRYEAELRQHDHIDFEDMIGKALHYVETGCFQGNWKYILVDEFQDISRPRARLVRALRNQHFDGSLFCVGDDWQSIYRFAGSDIELIADFQSYFGPTEKTALDKTFRFNSSINAVASRFVMQNSRQLRKSIQSHKVVSGAAISLYKTRQHSQDVLPEVLARILQIAEPGASVYFLARFRFDLPDNLRVLQKQFPSLVLKCDSIHASKGKEADYVILLGLGQGMHGMPSEKMSHPLVETLLPKMEVHPHAEERRLFYVALTRAKHRIYLIADMTKASLFVRELLDGKYNIEEDEFESTTNQENIPSLACPSCKEGILTVRKNATGSKKFMGCSNFPRCDHTENLCSKCSSPLRRKGSYKLCVNQNCSEWIAICPVSGGDMQRRYNGTRKFWGCSHYRGDEKPSCHYTETYIDPPI